MNNLITENFNVHLVAPSVRRDLISKIRDSLNSNPLAVEKAIKFLFARQTQDEQIEKVTKHSNTRGFAHPHARLGTYYGKWLAAGYHLSDGHLIKARALAQRYAATQLLELAAQRYLIVQSDMKAERAAIQAEMG